MAPKKKCYIRQRVKDLGNLFEIRHHEGVKEEQRNREFSLLCSTIVEIMYESVN